MLQTAYVYTVTIWPRKIKPCTHNSSTCSHATRASGVRSVGYGRVRKNVGTRFVALVYFANKNFSFISGSLSLMRVPEAYSRLHRYLIPTQEDGNALMNFLGKW
ncbi:hypothetical protein EVAR_53923_1 [Eumeta japonica]|uniref:Uncharacterized protein n=1 Tax=Eumeta variegata TaxID=151549 RepID=A0A4C1YN79_EUMVA|nr:hypothetical protein EVAR_53920_1 [Eumeta japonica]GBP75850.1 hypothetical protein EVAR_53923_1 [Eumeta japonica]